MYLTDEKTKHSSWVGSYQTRKWNDVTSIIYFEKIYGGKSLLKKIQLEAENTGFKFNSSITNSSICSRESTNAFPIQIITNKV